MITAPAPTRVPVLDRDEAAAVASAVHELREHWVPRAGDLPLFTLGAPAYLDGLGGFAAYRERVAATAPLLDARFGPLLGGVADALSSALGAPCRQAPGLGRPGFHVYLAAAAFGEVAGRPHFDLQAEQIVWDGLAVDLDRQLSFTLPVRLPRAGGGLLVWPLDRAVLAGTFPEMRRRRLAERGEATRHEYRLGELVVHPGSWLHQIAPMPAMEPDDERITLQGHAVAGEEGWWLYW